MIQVLEFVFSGFWTWLGSFMMLSCVCFYLSQARIFTVVVKVERRL